MERDYERSVNKKKTISRQINSYVPFWASYFVMLVKCLTVKPLWNSTRLKNVEWNAEVVLTGIHWPVHHNITAAKQFCEYLESCHFYCTLSLSLVKISALFVLVQWLKKMGLLYLSEKVFHFLTSSEITGKRRNLNQKRTLTRQGYCRSRFSWYPL